MKNLFKKVLFVLPVLFLTSCSNDDDNNITPFEGQTMTYDLNSVADPSISGTAKFIENENGSTTIELQLTGTPDGGMHPAHIHFNTAAEMGAVAITLGTVNGDTGFSTVTVSTLDENQGSTAISYDELLDFDGYINVHLSADDLGTLVAQGDIGQNELTGETTTYPLASVSDPAISGNVTFENRVNGEALATIDLDGTTDGVIYPAHIHMGSVATAPGDIILTFSSVNGANGISKTNIRNLMGSIEFFGYDDVLAVDGYVNVHNPEPEDLSVLVAQGNIGSN